MTLLIATSTALYADRRTVSAVEKASMMVSVFLLRRTANVVHQ